MSDKPIEKTESVLIQETFDKLLLLLDPDHEIAGRKYEEIRKKLIKYFAWQGCVCPEDLADKTVDRVSEIINRGDEIRNLNSYVLTVAQYILKEYQRKQKKEPLPLDDLSTHQHPTTDDSELDEQQKLEQRLKCLERCTQDLPQKDRELIVQYYQGEKRERIENRERTAKQIGISSNALSIQVYRIKNKLERCVSNCLKQLPED